MRCPYCGARRTEVLKTVYRGHNSYRHRRCLHCGSRFSTKERPVRWSRVERKWPGPRPSRKGWRSERTPALRGKCEVETCGVDFELAGIRRHVDHIVPARLIRRLRVGNPNRRENLQCICATCHGTNLRLTTSYAWGISWATWRFFAPATLILGELSARYPCTAFSLGGKAASIREAIYAKYLLSLILGRHT
jgi:hypothetical protein